MVGSERIPVHTGFGSDTIPVYSQGSYRVWFRHDSSWFRETRFQFISWLVQRGFQFIQGYSWFRHDSSGSEDSSIHGWFREDSSLYRVWFRHDSSMFMVGSERIPVYTGFGSDTIPLYSWLVQRGFQFIQGLV